MPSLLERWTASRAEPPASQRSLSLSDYLLLAGTSFAFNGTSYTVGGVTRPTEQFENIVREVHHKDNVVSAAVVTRGLLLSSLRFAWRNNRRGEDRYRQLFGTQGLLGLERPAGMTLPEMLMAAEFHVSYGGAAFFHRTPAGAKLLAPDLVDVVLESDGSAYLDDVIHRPTSARKVGYVFWAGGRNDRDAAVPMRLDEVAHWMPEPDPVRWWTGSPWVGSVLDEVVTDRAASRYLREHLSNAAMPATVVRPHELLSPEQIDQYAEKFEKTYSGVANAGKTMWLGGGSQIDVIGSKIAELDIRNLTGGLETRVAARARIPAAILGIRESLAGSSLNAGNYSSARRMLADGWFTPTAMGLCRTLETIAPPPPGAELWYDPADILFLQEDQKDQAEILAAQAAAIRQLVDGGFDPATAVEAVRDNNLTALTHSGLTSVQLLPPGEGNRPHE